MRKVEIIYDKKKEINGKLNNRRKYKMEQTIFRESRDKE